MIHRLRNKFIAIAILSVILVLLILIGAMNVLNYRNLVKEADNTLALLAENGGVFPHQKPKFTKRPTSETSQDGKLTTDSLPPELDNETQHFGDEFFAHREITAELPYQSRYFIAEFDADGSLDKLNVDNIASVDADEAETIAKQVYAVDRSRGFVQAFRYARTIENGRTTLTFLSCGRELSTFRSFLLASIGISTIGIVAVFLLIVLFSGRILRPVVESYEKQKQFITDAGHELKTPITIINADVDVLETELENNEWLTDIRTQTSRLTALTTDLIYLSKMEEEGLRISMMEFPLSDVVSETAQSFHAVAVSQNKTLSVIVQPMLTMNGDEKAIRKLISILLDNAMKYSSEHGKIRVDLIKEGKQARLTVFNTAENVEKGNADRLFDRFYRTDASRNSETGGFGLGLAVAKAVTEAHKGRIHAESKDGASLTIEAVLPLQQREA